jgi:methionine sulfoxide reductase catalytic subunit
MASEPPEDVPVPAASGVSPDVVRSYRESLTLGEDVIDPARWAGSVPQATGIAPRVRVGRSRWVESHSVV